MSNSSEEELFKQILRVKLEKQGKSPEVIEHAVATISEAIDDRERNLRSNGDISVSTMTAIVSGRLKGFFTDPAPSLDGLSDKDLVSVTLDLKTLAESTRLLTEVASAAMVHRLSEGKTLAQSREDTLAGPLGPLFAMLEQLLKNKLVNKSESPADQAVRESQKNTSRFDWDGLGFK